MRYTQITDVIKFAILLLELKFIELIQNDLTENSHTTEQAS